MLGKQPSCLIGYIWLMFGSGTDDFFATTSGMAQPVHVVTMLVTSRKFGFVHEILEQPSLCKYKGRPHPGKGSERTFTHPRCAIADRYPLLPKLLKAQADLDPDLVFEPPLFAAVKARRGYSTDARANVTRAE
ncbi:MAG: hypothetical protein J3K34DRAFT_470110 [Monoraphidium minutum]|nr:MAG: hypothetical protein J3K34DRAFT_470110 [Monoraphidium minutum]